MKIQPIKKISTLSDLIAPFFTAINLTFFKLGYPKSSSPQTFKEDMEIIYAVFAGSVIREGVGRQATPGVHYPKYSFGSSNSVCWKFSS